MEFHQAVAMSDAWNGYLITFFTGVTMLVTLGGYRAVRMINGLSNPIRLKRAKPVAYVFDADLRAPLSSHQNHDRAVSIWMFNHSSVPQALYLDRQKTKILWPLIRLRRPGRLKKIPIYHFIRMAPTAQDEFPFDPYGGGNHDIVLVRPWKIERPSLIRRWVGWKPPQESQRLLLRMRGETTSGKNVRWTGIVRTRPRTNPSEQAIEWQKRQKATEEKRAQEENGP